MAKLGEVCLINPKSCTLRDDTEVSFIPMTKVGEHGEFDASEIKNYSEVKKGFTNFQNGDILFAKITPCMENGKGAIANNMKNGIGFGSTEFYVLRPDTDKITSEWLYYLTTWETFRKEAERNMTGSAGQKRVPKTFLENYVVNLPDIDTQKSENKILRKVDDLIFLRKQQLAKLDELVKARFVEMFGDPVANIANWPIERLEKHLTIIGGYAFKSDGFRAKGIPVLRIGNINSGYFQPTNMVYWHDDSTLERYKMHPGDLVISLTGTVGKNDYGNVCILGNDYSEYYLNQRNAKLELNETLNGIYLSELLKFPQIKGRLTGISRGIRQANISNKDILSLPILIPPISLQKQFAAFVERVERQKQTVQQSLEKLELMKKALMQEYFG